MRNEVKSAEARKSEGGSEEVKSEEPNQQGSSPTALIVIVIVLVVLVLGGVGIGGYFIYKVSKAKQATDDTLNKIRALVATTVPATPETPTPTTKLPSASAYDYSKASGNGLYPWTSTRLVTAADLAGKSQWDMDIMRNEIYARYGRSFVRDDLQNYFNQQSWYQPNSNFTESWLTSTESKNAAFIADWQKTH